MEDEISGKVEQNKAWDVVKRQDKMRVLRSRWVFKFTELPDGSIKVKARVVACGYGQREGIDYTEVFAATLASTSFRLLTANIATSDLETDTMDAYKAYTQADIDCILYIEMPAGFACPGWVLRLRKALEGIKQGAHLWFNLNRDVLIALGFVSCIHEPNLYRFPGTRIVIGVFADDILAAFHRSEATIYMGLKCAYAAKIKVATLDIIPVVSFIGVEIERDRERGTITLRQVNYIEQAFDRYKSEITKCSTPYGGRDDASKFDSIKKAPEADRIDQILYLKLCGAVVWPASMTHPDIQFAVSVLCTFVVSPGADHYKALLNVLGYLHKTKHMGLTYSGTLRVPLGLTEMPDCFGESIGLHTYHDSSFGKGPFPWGGYAVFYANAAVMWRCSKLKLVADSTAYVEMSVATKAAHATVAVRSTLEEIDHAVVGPTPLIGDSKAVRDIIVKSGSLTRTRHFELAEMAAKHFYQMLIVVPYLVGTKDMVADIFTKALDAAPFFHLRGYMLNLDNGPGTRVVLYGQVARMWSKLLGRR